MLVRVDHVSWVDNNLGVAELRQVADAAAIASNWDARLSDAPVKRKFWQIPAITAHINRKITGTSAKGGATGINAKVKEVGPFENAVSIGSGLGGKEMRLLLDGVVQHFDLFELATARMKEAERNYAAAGLSGRASFNTYDAFSAERADVYDLVYWNSSLHHMPSARRAVEWSWRALKTGGCLAMFEYVGPTRFQWSAQNLHYMNRFLATVPERFFRIPEHPKRLASRTIRRPTIDAMLARDPSEAADSAAIIPSLAAFFPNAEIVPLGGAIYHVGLKPILPNVEGDEDGRAILQQALFIDDLLTGLGENQFAYCLARKE